MRVTERFTRPNGSDERGATAVIVALSLIAILGLVVLTVDVGQLLFKRRAMVNASDAAALAAAQSCAGVGDSDDPGSVANAYAAENVSIATGGITEIVGCDGPGVGHVSVEYQMQQELFFAGVLGFDGPGTVRTRATAAWGVARGADVVPVMFDQTWLTNVCGFPEEPPSSEAQEGECAFLWDNDQIGNSTWGFLNLNEWDVESNGNCTGAGGAGEAAGLKRYIRDGGTGEQLPLNYPGPTYVCAMTGLVEDAWMELDARAGDILFFPVVDPDTQIPARPADPDKYNVIAFIALRVQEVSKVESSPDIRGTCGGFDYPSPIAAGSVLDLEEIGASVGCFDLPVKDVSGVQLRRLGGGGGPFVEGTDYTFDQTQHTVTWRGAPQSGLNVKFQWVKAGEATCGEQVTTNSSGVCVIVSWPGPQMGGTGVLEQGHPQLTQFALRAIMLCDLAIGSCPDTS